MNLNFENRDRLIRDIKEGEPRFEGKQEKMDRENVPPSSGETGTEKGKSSSASISAAQAHSVAVAVYTDQQVCATLKELVAERLLNKLPLTRMDVGIKGTAQEYDEQYGLTHQHLAELKDGRFLCFDLVSDGDDLAMTFTKTNGDKALRPFDDRVLAELLNQVQKIHPSALPEGLLSGIRTS